MCLGFPQLLMVLRKRLGLQKFALSVRAYDGLRVQKHVSLNPKP